MPTASENARSEAGRWEQLLRWVPDLVPELYADVPPRELALVGFYDPAGDLERREGRWGFRLEGPDLPHLAAAASALAAEEADAWERGIPDLALEKYEGRRLLFGERIIHWAAPWLDGVGRCYPEHRAEAHQDRDWMLALGDEMRPAPSFGGGEGLTLPGEDSYGPLDVDVPVERWVRSLWSGAVVFDATLESMGLSPEELGEAYAAEDLGHLFEAASGRWASAGRNHPGSARLWMDLSARAHRTFERLIG